MTSDPETPLRCVSLFSGCGGLDLGLHRAGFDIALANDNDPRCADSHRLNFPDTPFYEGSVADLDGARVSELTSGATDEGVALLVGGPPCPPFSKSRFYRKDMPRALADPVGAETIGGYLDLLRDLRPGAFLMENVHGLAYKVHGEALDFIIRTAEELGYECEWRVLNAADYGVPQIRQRLFLVGTRTGRFAWPEPTHVNPNKRGPLETDLSDWPTAGEAIGDLDTDDNGDDEGHFAGGKHHHLLQEVPPGDNYLYFTAERGHPNPQFRWRSRYWSFLLKLSPDKPSWTIQARRSNNMGPFHWRNRILRIQEIKRLQTFPHHWKLAGTVEQQWRQIGNAVPPRLAEHLGAAIRSAAEDDVPAGSGKWAV